MLSHFNKIAVLSIIFQFVLNPQVSFAGNKLLITNGTIISMKANEVTPYIGYVVVDDAGKITTVGKGTPSKTITAKSTYNATGQYILPGFISGHSHLSESAFRGLATDQHVYEYPSMAGWVGALWKREDKTIPEDYYWFTLQGSLDHLVHGITSVYNFTYSKNDEVGFAEAQWRGMRDSGIRFIHSYEPAGNTAEKERRENLEKFLKYIESDKDKPTVLKLAYSGWLNRPVNFQIDAKLIHDYKLYSEIHYLESPVNVDMQQKTFSVIKNANVLGPNVSFGHFIHTNDAILKTVAKSGSGMIWNPMSNGRLASGIADIPKYRQLGIKIGMGVDGQGSADLPDPFENMRTGLYTIRAKYQDAKVLQPIDVLRFHTIGSAEVLGIDDKVGSLEAGKYGDIVVIDTHLAERGPIIDPYAAIVLACNSMNIAKVYVGGELMVDHYQLQKSNMKTVSEEVTKRVAKLS